MADLTFELIAGGQEKKTTGSYYTRPELVHELIKSALVPVLEDRLAVDQGLRTSGNKRSSAWRCAIRPAGRATSYWPALVGLGRELAQARTGEEEPTPIEFRRAVRDVIQHCVYGVDLNPLGGGSVQACVVDRGPQYWFAADVPRPSHQVRKQPGRSVFNGHSGRRYSY